MKSFIHFFLFFKRICVEWGFELRSKTWLPAVDIFNFNFPSNFRIFSKIFDCPKGLLTLSISGNFFKFSNFPTFPIFKLFQNVFKGANSLG